MLNLNELNFDDAMDFYEQMQIDEILMRENEGNEFKKENEPIENLQEFNFNLEEKRLNILFPNQTA